MKRGVFSLNALHTLKNRSVFVQFYIQLTHPGSILVQQNGFELSEGCRFFVANFCT